MEDEEQIEYNGPCRSCEGTGVMTGQRVRGLEIIEHSQPCVMCDGGRYWDQLIVDEARQEQEDYAADALAEQERLDHTHE